MSKYKAFACIIIIMESILVLLCNGIFLVQNRTGSGKLYRVEASRIAAEIKEQSINEADLASLDLSKYKTIVGVSIFSPDEVCGNDYVIQEIDGKLYQMEYCSDKQGQMLFYLNSALLCMMLITGAVLFYIDRKVLKPFHAIRNLSYELAKGNLSVPVKEEKSKLFGRFLWGMDMLREKLEDNREKELEFQKDKKTLLLSLSHDIKTPLSSIELYSKALYENLYDTQTQRDEALLGISRNVREIKKYVDEISAASREDFLNLEVIPAEFYLLEVIWSIKDYYRDKLSVLHTEFFVEEFSQCLIQGDKNRLVEVLQNIMENAIKYGDGKRIRIYGEDEEDCKLIHIENSGNSLNAEELPNLFDSFYRGSNSHGIKGNGLGLYICKVLMRKMNGDVFAQISRENFRVSVVIRKA